jgi:hypothetical protein
MTTMLDMVADTRRMAYGSLNDQINLVAQPAAAGATDIVMEIDVSGITPGMMLSSGLNVWYVRSIDVATNTVTVIPGFDNSPKNAVTPGDFVFIKPRVTDWYLFEMLNQEIMRLSAPDNNLYKIAAWETIVDPTWQTYIFPEEAMSMIGMLRVRFRMPGSPDVWYDVPEKAYRIQIEDDISRIRLLRNIPSGTDIKFIYKAPFTRATSLADDVVEVCGLTESMTDIPPLGALTTLLRTSESRRNQVQQQGDARRATEVAAGSNSSIAVLNDREYRARVREEATRLVSRVPIQRSL